MQHADKIKIKNKHFAQFNNLKNKAYFKNDNKNVSIHVIVAKKCISPVRCEGDEKSVIYN